MNKDKINKVISVYNYKKRFFLEFDEEQGWIIADNIAESLKRKEHVEVSFDRVPKVSFVFITSMLGKLLICHGFSVEELEEMWSRAFQHEFDHIEGILFTDKLSVMNKRLVAKKLDVLKRDFTKGRIYRDLDE